ncbi:MAG: hypothetical protein ACKVOH_00590 [Chlamydiales bacterium]
MIANFLKFFILLSSSLFALEIVDIEKEPTVERCIVAPWHLDHWRVTLDDGTLWRTRQIKPAELYWEVGDEITIQYSPAPLFGSYGDYLLTDVRRGETKRFALLCSPEPSK